MNEIRKEICKVRNKQISVAVVVNLLKGVFCIEFIVFCQIYPILFDLNIKDGSIYFFINFVFYIRFETTYGEQKVGEFPFKLN